MRHNNLISIIKRIAISGKSYQNHYAQVIFSAHAFTLLGTKLIPYKVKKLLMSIFNIFCLIGNQ